MLIFRAYSTAFLVFHSICQRILANKPFICSKSTMKTQKQCMKSVQNLQQRHQNDMNDVKTNGKMARNRCVPKRKLKNTSMKMLLDLQKLHTWASRSILLKSKLQSMTFIPTNIPAITEPSSESMILFSSYQSLKTTEVSQVKFAQWNFQIDVTTHRAVRVSKIN